MKGVLSLSERLYDEQVMSKSNISDRKIDKGIDQTVLKTAGSDLDQYPSILHI